MEYTTRNTPHGIHHTEYTTCTEGDTCRGSAGPPETGGEGAAGGREQGRGSRGAGEPPGPGRGGSRKDSFRRRRGAAGHEEAGEGERAAEEEEEELREGGGRGCAFGTSSTTRIG